MNPAELILTGGIALGIAVPMTAAIEAGREPADMSRYEMRSDCQVDKDIVDRCIVDVETGWALGVEPIHIIELEPAAPLAD